MAGKLWGPIALKPYRYSLNMTSHLKELIC